VLVALLAGALYWAFHRSPKLTDKDTIVLADFTNTTGDPVFDDSLKPALAVSLQQSPFLSLLSDQQVQQTLHLMGRPSTPLNRDVASEVCQRNGAKAMLAGTITAVGSQYLISVDAVNCVTGASQGHELGLPEPLVAPLSVLYLRGYALLKGGQAKEAAAEFQRILDRPGIVLNSPIASLAHLGLGRALAASSNSAGSRTAYQHFLALRKDAGPDIPILKQAKAEYAKLQ